MTGMNLKNGLIVAALGLGMFSCGNSEPQDVNVVDTTSQEDVLTEDMFESPDVDYHLLSPLQVASIFKKSGLAYHSNITNPTANSSKYTEELKQMLNFGVYSADMAYCVLNEQSNEGRKYLAVITDLAEQIGMESVFENKDLMDRFDKNIENKDSIEILMIDIHERTETYMEENDMQHKSSIHFAGAWTEGMYLGVYVYEKNKTKEGLTTRQDIEAPLTQVWATVADFEAWERAAMRRGVEVQRTDALRAPASGMGWKARFRYRGKERLYEINAAHEAAGVMIANPHVVSLEDGSRHKRADADQMGFKAETDPHGLLNPGKMRSYVPVKA